MFFINLQGGLPIYEQLFNRISELISSGALKPDEKLPAVREVARELGINPNTVQKTYQLLDQKGLIYSIPAKGCYVAKGDRAVEEIRAKALENFRKSTENALKCGIQKTTLIKELEMVSA